MTFFVVYHVGAHMIQLLPEIMITPHVTLFMDMQRCGSPVNFFKTNARPPSIFMYADSSVMCSDDELKNAIVVWRILNSKHLLGRLREKKATTTKHKKKKEIQ